MNPYWDNNCALAEKQRAKGIKTYGTGIEENLAGIITRINYLEEELVDALMYCEWIKDYLTKENTKDGVKTICENCTESIGGDDCPEGRVWCKKMCRYMKNDGYCSFGRIEE